ncbi:MotA/TolQ/ExbB proton channel family protein [Alteromonas aestuariivivens]|uniref:MotA/TolQ/ExbB proton channel family protein n=1 Tax=Alteromonas aestuariivivens TaxID=1938339 RepID=A0A3D8MEJ0_9ALTE|nr:MotA/TolQ/ExbB proton channel family protein [Alteromonas aestuariivivens]RDV29245.1 MotA/TolQ/ExbB proton channel family protein [Alteromonas aestuariivivens]
MKMLNPFVRLKSLAHLSLAGVLIAAPVAAQEDPLADLLNTVKSDLKAESAHNQQREAEFISSYQQQVELQKAADTQLANLVTKREQLKNQFDLNEQELTELNTLLKNRVGDLGELFGVFRQMAGDVQSGLYDSLVSLEMPERQQAIQTLASRTEVPRIEEMTQLWTLMLDEIAASGKVSRFTADVVKPNGEHYQSEVTRVGTFNVVTDDLFLNYLPENNELVEFARQPEGYHRDTAAGLSASQNERVAFSIDPSRGVLLGLLVQSPTLMERIEQGKEVGYVILGLLLVGMLLVLSRFYALKRLGSGMKKQMADLDQFNNDNPLGRALGVYYESRHLEVDVLSKKLDEVILKDINEFKKGLPVLKVLAAIAPLMGLLGTVTGMIGTFQAITLFGTGDPKLMAGGISQALVTTVLGLVAAIPLLLSHSFLSSKAQGLTKILAEQAAGMISSQAEKMAAPREKQHA